MRADRRRLFAALPLVLAALLFVAPWGAPLATPEIQTWHTDNGAKVLFVAAPDLPMLDVQVVFAAGSARDGARPGLASLTASLLTAGAGDWDADAFAERVEAVGAAISASADRDMATVSLRTRTIPEALDLAVESLAQLLAAPRFDPGDIERVRRQRLIALRLAEQSPGSVGSKAIWRAIFGDHPYASDPDGSAESVAALTREEIVAFHRDHYSAANATLALVGALERAQAEILAERILAGLPRGQAAASLPPVAELAAGGGETHTFPSSQTHLLLGQPGVRRGDPDYYPLYVGNHILGGSGLVSLLMEEVRERRGLSYSVYSYFLPLAERGPFLLGLQTQNAQAGDAEAVLRATLERFVAEGPTAAQLEAAIQNITGGFPLRIASNAKIVGYLAMIGFYDLPLDHLERFTERVAAVTSEQIRDAFARRIHPKRLRAVRVGRPAAAGGESSAPDLSDDSAADPAPAG